MRSMPKVHPRRCSAPKRRHRRRGWFWARLCLVAAVLLFGLFQLEARVRPVLLTIVEYESRRYAMSAFNDAVAELIESDPDAYQGLFRLTYNDDGSIAAVQADAYGLNRLASALTESAENKMNGLEDSELSVPIGSMLGLQALAGRGPRMRMHIMPETYVSARVYDTFESAGINQTKLCMYVHFDMEMSVILSGYSTDVAAEADICLAQIMLVGEIPGSYWKSR